MKRFRAQLFGSHPYARQPGGEPETVAALTQIDLVAAHRLAFRPENMVVSIVGDISLEDARTLVASAFGDMEASGEPVLEARRSFAPSASRTEFERDVEQGIVVLGTRGCSHSDPDSAALDVATAILGQGMSSRLFTELRDKQGLAYMVGAQSNEMHLAGFVLTYIGTSPATVDRALDGLWEQMSLMREEPVTTEELERAIAYLVGGYLRDHESNSRQAYYLGFWEACGLGAEYDTRYPELVRAVTVRDVMKVANKYFNDPTVVVLRPRPGPAATEAAPAP
jgi:predicted Zn-dependent peptidase